MYDFTVYLIHLDSPICHARHYIGFTGDLNERMKRHRSGNGARLLNAANKRGIHYEIVKTWKTGRWVNAAITLEHKLKNRHNAARMCPVCLEIRRKKNE